MAFSILTASVLFFYVYYEGGLEIERNVKVNVKLTGLSKGLIALDYPSIVEVRIKGPNRRVSSVSPDDIKAIIDLKNKREGQHIISIDYILPQRIRILEEVQEKYLISIEKLVNRNFDIEIKIVGDIVEGTYLYPPILRPTSVEVRGPESKVNEVYKVIVEANVSQISQDYSNNLKPKIINTQGVELSSIEVFPEHVHVLIPIKIELVSKGVPVIPNLRGSLKVGYSIVEVETEPKIIYIKGRPLVLKEIDSLSTEPINIDMLSESTVIESKLRPMENVEILNNLSVKVRIVIKKLLTKQFSNVTISKLDHYKFYPQSVDMLIMGEEEMLNRLKVDDIIVKIKKPLIKPSNGQEEVIVELPPNFYLIWLNPAKIMVIKE